MAWVCPAIAADRGVASAGQGVPLAELLGPDGRIDLERGFTGSVDPTGYRMAKGPGGEPRFVPVGQSGAVSAASGTPDDNWDDRFSHPAPGVDRPRSANSTGEDVGSVWAIAVTGSGEVIVAGSFSRAVDGSGEVPANNIARWDGSAWSALGTGVDGPVYSLAVSGSDIYAGGQFVTAGGVTVNNVARWDGASWSALGTGTEWSYGAYVNALAFVGSDLYVGGRFTQAGGRGASNIARWNGSVWSALEVWPSNGLTGVVEALAVVGSDLYVGGFFDQVAGGDVSNLARWNGSVWSEVGSSPWDLEGVTSLLASGSDLFVGGAEGRVQKWDGNSWSAMGSISNSQFRVSGLAVIGSDVFAASVDTGFDGCVIYTWDEGSRQWTSPPEQIVSMPQDHVSAGKVYTLTTSGEALYVGGNFSKVGLVDASFAHSVAVWEAGSWSTFGAGGQGIDGPVHALLGDGTDLYASGFFAAAGAAAATGIGRWDGIAWNAFPPLGELGRDGNPIAAVAILGGDLFVGGAYGVERWDGTSWTQIGAVSPDILPLEGVTSLVVVGSDLYAGGDFASINGVMATSVARWDGITWSSLGGVGGLSPVKAMLAIGSDLIVGGSFSTFGGAPANHIARWDGSAWSALGSGTNGDVLALAEGNGVLFAGGEFSTAGGVTANNVAQWDGSTWSAIGTGTDGPVRALLANGSDLVVGGDFSTAGGTSTNNLAVWNGFGWTALGSGIDLGDPAMDGVHALAVADGALWVGGWFSAAGGKWSSRIARWTAPCGDGTVDLLERCDDGNVLDGDCCSSTCQIEPDGSPCDDGDACIIGETCQLGSCEGTAIGCVNFNPCEISGCDPAIGCYADPRPDGTSCDDEDACTTGDACSSGTCVGGGSTDCDDVDDCTAESCDAVTGCASVPVAGCTSPVALPAGGDLLVADGERSALLRLDSTSGDRTIMSSAATGTGPAPSGSMAVGLDPSTGALWLGTSAGELLRVDPGTGDRVVVASDSVGSGPGLGSIQDIEVEPSGDVLVATDGAMAPPLRVDPATGDRVATYTGDPTCCFDPLVPSVAVDDNSDLLVGSLGVGPGTITLIDAGTGVASIVSATGGPGTGPHLNGPWDMVVEPDGSILALGADALLRVDPLTGNRTLLSGRGTGSGPDFQDARGLVRASDTDAYVSDPQADRVVHVDLVSGARTVVSDATTGQGTTLAAPGHLLTVVDGDADGVSDLVEHAAPNAGDGNADGTPDAEQMDVASLPDGEGVDMLTVAVGGGCAELLDVAALSESALAEDDLLFDYPLGLVSFRLPCSSADVTLLFHGASSLAPPYRKYGPTTPGDPATTGWYTLPGAAFGSVDVGGTPVAQVAFSLADGVLGDDTGLDGEIVDLGGPAAPDAKASVQAFDATLSIVPVDPLAPVLTATGTGVAPVRGGFGGDPLTAFSLPAGAMGTTSQAGFTPSATLWIADLSNGTGVFQADTAGALGGVMPARGLLRYCLIVGCGWNFPLPFTENGTRGIGIGGSPIVATTPTVTIVATLQGAPWTSATTTLPTPSGTVTRAGYLHGPLSTTSPTWASLTSGVVQLVTPVAIDTSVGQSFPAFGVLTVHFVPEPSKLTMLAAGAAFLWVLGRRRRR